MATDPYVNVHANASAIIKALAKKIYTDTRSWAASTWIGRGWDWKSTEHATGRALDVIISTSVGRLPTAEQKADGYRICEWLIKNANVLHIRHIIWDKKIYRARYKAWGPLPGRTASSNISDWHQDHIHVYLEDANGSVPTSTIFDGVSTAPIPSLPTAPAWDGKSFPGASAFVLNKSHPAVTLLGQRLKAHGYGYFYKEGPGPTFTTTDQAATKSFQLRQGWTGDDANGYPGPETWRRLMLAVESKPQVSITQLVAAFKNDAPKAGTPISYPPTLIVEAALVKEGLLAAKYADGHAGTATKTAYAGWQKRCGWTGKAADGIPGRASLDMLGKKYGFLVTA